MLESIVFGCARWFGQREQWQSPARERWGKLGAVGVLALLFAFAGGCCLPLAASEEKDEEEDELIQDFFVAETVYAQPKGGTQITLMSRYDEGTAEWQSPLILEYGITSRFQVGVELPYVSRRMGEGGRTSGLGDIEAGVLYALSSNLDTLAVSAGLEVGLPTGSEERELGEGKTTWEPFVTFGRKLGRGQTHFGFRVGTGDETDLGYNLAYVLPAGRLRWTLELTGDASKEPTVALTPGLIWKAPRGAEWGLGISRGLNSKTPHWSGIAQYTIEF